MAASATHRVFPIAVPRDVPQSLDVGPSVNIDDGYTEHSSVFVSLWSSSLSLRVFCDVGI